MKKRLTKILCIALAAVLLSGVFMPQLTSVVEAKDSGALDLGSVIGDLSSLGGGLGDLDLGGWFPDIDWPWEKDEPTEEPTEEPATYPEEEATRYPEEETTRYPEDETTRYPEDEPTTYPMAEPTTYPSELTYPCGCVHGCPCKGKCDSDCKNCGFGCDCEVLVISEIAFESAKPIVLYKNISVRYDERYPDNQRYIVAFSKNDKLFVTYANGTTKEFYLEYGYYSGGTYYGDFLSSDGEELHCSIYSDDDYENPWGVGEHTATIECNKKGNGVSCTVPVTVAECPVKSISAQYKYTLYDGYSCEIGGYYRNYIRKEYILCKLEYKDGSVAEVSLTEIEELFNLECDIEFSFEKIGVNEGTISLGVIKGPFTVTVEETPSADKPLPECYTLGSSWHYFEGETVELQLLNIADKGYTHYYEIFDMPEGFTLSDDGKLRFTLPEDSAGSVYTLNFELRWKNTYAYYIFSKKIFSESRDAVEKIPEKAIDITYEELIKAEAASEKPQWYRIRAAAGEIALSTGKLSLYNSDGVKINYYSGPLGDGPWISQYIYSVIRGEYYYIKATENCEFVASLNPWLPSYNADDSEPGTSASEEELIATNVKKTFENDDNEVWNVYKMTGRYEADMKDGFTYYKVGLMYRFASPVNIHYTTESYTSNCDILYLAEYTYDPNGAYVGWLGADKNQDTMEDELLPGETEYRMDNVYYFMEQTGLMTIDEVRHIYIPQGYVIEDDHIIKHAGAEHSDKDKNGFCDICSADISKDEPVPEEPTTDKPEPEEPTTGKPEPEEPTTGKPEPEEPATGKPVPEEPTTGKPEPEEPATDKPEPEEPTTGKPDDKPTTVVIKLGDIDGDNAVSAKDARLALRASVGLEKLASDVIETADINSDGKITAADARLILRTSVGLEKVITASKMPATTAEIVELYKSGVDRIKKTGVGYTKKGYQEVDKINIAPMLNTAVKTIADDMATSKKEAKELISAKGSDEAKYRIAAWTLTDLSKVKSASCTKVGDNCKITICMQDEDTPMKKGSVLGQVTGNLIYWEDLKSTIENDPTINKLVASYKDIHVVYKGFTIEAEITPEGEFSYIKHTADIDVLIGEARFPVITVNNKSIHAYAYEEFYDFVY